MIHYPWLFQQPYTYRTKYSEFSTHNSVFIEYILNQDESTQRYFPTRILRIIMHWVPIKYILLILGKFIEVLIKSIEKMVNQTYYFQLVVSKYTSVHCTYITDEILKS